MKQSSWLDNLVWVLLILFLVPSSVVVFSWNSLPGSRLFKTKLIMEDAILALAPTQEVRGDLHVAFTERRVSEATKLLADSSSTEGLVYLNAEIQKAKESIQQAPTSEVKKENTKKYIATLRNVSSQLEQQRQTMAPQRPIVIIQERVIVQQPIYIGQQPATPTPVPSVPGNGQQSNTEIVTTIQNIQSTIQSLESDDDGERGGYREKIHQKQLKELEK